MQHFDPEKFFDATPAVEPASALFAQVAVASSSGPAAVGHGIRSSSQMARARTRAGDKLRETVFGTAGSMEKVKRRIYEKVTIKAKQQGNVRTVSKCPPFHRCDTMTRTTYARRAQENTRLLKVFRAIDSNSSGSITFAEFRTAMGPALLNLGMSDEDIHDLCLEFDKDMVGVITTEAFINTLAAQDVTEGYDPMAQSAQLEVGVGGWVGVCVCVWGGGAHCWACDLTTAAAVGGNPRCDARAPATAAPQAMVA